MLSIAGRRVVLAVRVVAVHAETSGWVDQGELARRRRETPIRKILDIFDGFGYFTGFKVACTHHYVHRVPFPVGL
jgi:hypothetical protein